MRLSIGSVQDALSAGVLAALAHELLQVHASATLRGIVEDVLPVSL